MLIRPALSPVMMTTMRVGTRNLRGSVVPRVPLIHLQQQPRMAASMTTKTTPRLSCSMSSSSSVSPTFLVTGTVASASLRSLSFAGLRLQQSAGIHRGSNSQTSLSLPPFVSLPHHPSSSSLGAVSYFSSQRGGGAPRGGGRMSMGAGMLGAGALLLGKGKYILGALKVTKLSTMVSMIVSVGAYSMIFGVPYACGMVGLIFVHESGHAMMMRHYGIPFSPMVFLPFMGAAIAMKNHPKDAWEDAMIAFGGPAVGSLGAGALAVGAHMTDSQLLMALADFGFMINMFNMLPIGDMDGGRIAGALSPYAGVVGLGMGGALIATVGVYNPIFYIIMLTGGYSTFQRFYDPVGHAPSPNYYRITNTQRTILGAGYFGLIGALVTAMAANGINKKSPEEIQRYQELSFDEREF